MLIKKALPEWIQKFCGIGTGNHRLIILLGLLLLFSIWFATGQRIMSEQRDELDDATRETTNLAISFDEYVRQIVSDVDYKLLDLKNTYEREGRDSPSVLAKMEYLRLDPTFRQAVITDQNGLVAISTKTLAVPVSMADWEHFRFLKDHNNDKIFIGKPIEGQVFGDLGIPMSRRINNPDGSFSGIVGLLVNIDHFFAFFQQMELGPDKMINVMGMDGIVRVRYFHGEQISGQDLSQGPLYLNASQKPIGTFRATSIVDNIERIYSYRVLPEYGLIVSVGASVQDILVGFEFRKKIYTASAAAGSFFILFFCGVLIQRNRKEHELQGLLEENNERLTLLHFSTSHLLQYEGRSDGQLQTILEDALQLLGAPDGHISLWNNSEHMFRICYGIGLHAPRVGEKISVHQGMHGQVYASGNLLYVKNYRAYPERLENVHCSSVVSAIMLPMKIKDRVAGVFAVTWRDEIYHLSDKKLDIIHQYAVLVIAGVGRKIWAICR